MTQLEIPNDHTIIEYGIITSVLQKSPELLLDNSDNYYRGNVLNSLTNEFLVSIPKDHFFARSLLVTKDSFDNIVYTYGLTHTYPPTKSALALDFENISKGSYASANVTIDGNEWTLNETLVGGLASDLKYETKSLRIRDFGFLKSNFPFEAGINTISFSYGLFGTDPPSSIAVEYAYEWDQNNWHRVPITTQTTELLISNNSALETITLSLNINASIYFRIIKTASAGRVNIDNLSINASEHTISFNSNGGTIVQPVTQAYLTHITKPQDPTFEGFTFDGWFIDSALTIPFVFDLMPYGTTVLHAKWIPLETYTGYYEGAAGLMGTDLESFLRTTVSTGFIGINYGDARYILDDTDRDPNNPNNLILVYLGTSVSGVWDSGVTWNREHVWPQSLLGVSASNSQINVASDLHSLKPANPAENSRRSNRYFDDTGASGSYEPRDVVKGDVARILLYKIIKYENLELVNSTAPIIYQMAMFSTLLRWHIFDPVDDFERNRNNVIFSYQNNRNPFIDHPEFAEKIWGTITLTSSSSSTLLQRATTVIICSRVYSIDFSLFKKTLGDNISI